MRKLIAMLIFAMTATVGVIAPASAVGLVTVQGDDLRLSAAKDCGEATIRVTVPYDVPNWTVDVSVYAPDGTYAGGGYYYDGADPNSIVDYIYLCADSNGTGTYSVVADVETHDSSYNPLGNYRVTDSFRFTKQPMVRSRFDVQVTPSGAHGWRVAGRLTRAGEPWSFKRTHIQVYYLGSWTKLYVRTTDRRGLVLWTTTPKPGAGQFRLRLYAPGTGTTEAATSRAFRLPAR